MNSKFWLKYLVADFVMVMLCILLGALVFKHCAPEVQQECVCSYECDEEK